MTMMLTVNRTIKSPTMLLLLALGTALMLATGVSAQYPQVGNDDYDGCRNPRGEPGRCISIYDCASIIALMKRPGRTSEDIRFVQQSGCGFEGNEPKVCCANSAPGIPNIGNGNGNNGPTDNRGTGSGGSNNDLLPRNCGDASSNDKIVGGQKAGLDEFPWMALLEYKKPRGMQTACGGVLISRRYVLTAAHCIVKGPNTVPTDWNLVNIRLGEYNTKTNPDCIPDGPYNEVCNEPLTNVPVEEEIVHEDYVPSPSSGYKHDIALVRLARDVEFTPFVKPICMPESADLAEVFFISGWGQTEFKSSSESKLKATIGPADRGSCEQQYKSYGITIGDGQICAGGQRGVDSCKGDSGGPLMKLVGAETANPKWVVQGVVSFGPSPCGQENWAGIYTNVWKYKDWILSKMRP